MAGPDCDARWSSAPSWLLGVLAIATSRNLSAGGVLSVDITAQPATDGTGGILSASVPTGGVSDDGRTLEFTLQIVQVSPDADLARWAWNTDTARILTCAPDAADDLPKYRADCVSGDDGFDAAYQGEADGLAVSTKVIDASGPYTYASSYSAALLLDQSAHMIVDDPADARLFAAKYFLNSGPNNHVALAAFASDDFPTSRISLLPQKPVTIFPSGNTQYTNDGRSLFAAVDSLATLEGGAAPLFAAIDQALDLAAANRTGENNAVAIVTVGLAGTAGTADHETLGLLAQGAAHGAAFWADNPKQLATIAGSARSYLADFKDALEVTFRIQSPVAGAFAPGRKVLGTVQLEVCPFDCVYTSVPFVVQVP